MSHIFNIFTVKKQMAPSVFGRRGMLPIRPKLPISPIGTSNRFSKSENRLANDQNQDRDTF